MRVGLLGVQCDTANLGLAALAYSVCGLVDRSLPGPAELVLFSINSDAELQRMRSELRLDGKIVRAVPFLLKQPRAMLRSFRELRSCDLVIDFTGGDSFSDIYGTKRLLRKLLHKQLVLAAGTPLVLAPQTYGPLKHGIAKPWYRHVIQHAAAVFTRDDLSVEFLRGLAGCDVRQATDVAVTLPHDPDRYVRPASGSVRVGLNVSGLLWAGGYTQNNQFGLAADYQQFCHQLVDAMTSAGFEVHLVPHVQSRPGEDGLEDDVQAAQTVLAAHPECRMAPPFNGPVDAKSWISTLDGLVGSRMHATIASFSAGVPTVPVAYSRKFAGLFGSLGYPVLVDLRTTPTSDAVRETMQHLENLPSLRAAAAPARGVAATRIKEFTGVLDTLLSQP